MKVIWSISANDQIISAADYIENKFGEKAKSVFLDNINHIVILLAFAPYLGKEEPLLEKAPVSYRSLSVDRINKIVYDINNNSIEIVALWDTRREPKSLIKDLEKPVEE